MDAAEFSSGVPLPVPLRLSQTGLGDRVLSGLHGSDHPPKGRRLGQKTSLPAQHATLPSLLTWLESWRSTFLSCQNSAVLIIFNFLAAPCCLWILVPLPGMGPVPPCRGSAEQSPNHWTIREFPKCQYFLSLIKPSPTLFLSPVPLSVAVECCRLLAPVCQAHIRG